MNDSNLDGLLSAWSELHAISPEQAEEIRQNVLSASLGAMTPQRQHKIARNALWKERPPIPAEALQSALAETLRVVEQTLALVVPRPPQLTGLWGREYRPYLRAA
jgi:hypothetical protein